MSAITAGCDVDVQRNQVSSHYSATLTTSRDSSISILPWIASATRNDVSKMIGRYVRMREAIRSVRSNAGRIIVSESRISERRRTEKQIAAYVKELLASGMSNVEIADAVNAAMIRHRVYALPQPRTDVKNADGTVMRCVAPRRLVAHIVKLKKSLRQQSESVNAVRDWVAGMGQFFALLTATEQAALLDAEGIRVRQRKRVHELAAARSDAGRFRSGGREARPLRAIAESRIASLNAEDVADAAELKHLVRTRNWRRGFERLHRVCTASEEIELFCFRD